MRILDFILVLLLLAMLGFGLWLLYENLPGPIKIQSGNFSAENINESYSEAIQFYPNMRYPDKSITYKIEDSCSNKKMADIESAFAILSEKTILTFSPSDTPEIDILCSNIAPTAAEKDHFVAGEGGPSEIVNTTAYSVILSGRIALYRAETCNTPQVAIHEILHVLGFDHSSYPKSIMFPVTDCKQKIDTSIIEAIDKLYSIPSAPDLSLVSINAFAHDRYLDFNATIANFGLKDSLYSWLVVSTESGEIKRFDLKQIDLGVKQTLEVQNLKMQRNAKSVFFTIETPEEEISKDNNVATISLS